MPIFEDSFESGDFSAWTQVVPIGNVVSDVKYSGNYSARFTTIAGQTPADQQAYARKDFVGEDVIHWRGYVRLGEAPTLDPFTTVSPFRLYAGGQVITKLTFTPRQGGELLAELRYPDPANPTYYTFAMPIEANRWYLIEVEFVRGVNGGIRVWLDETLVIVAVADTSMAPTPTGFFVGIEWCSDTGWRVWIDSVVVDNKYIGPEITPPPPPTEYVVTIRSLPILVPVTADDVNIGNTPISASVIEGTHKFSTPKEVQT